MNDCGGLLLFLLYGLCAGWAIIGTTIALCYMHNSRLPIENYTGLVITNKINYLSDGYCYYEYNKHGAIKSCPIFIENYFDLHNETLATISLNEVCPIDSTKMLYLNSDYDCFYTEQRVVYPWKPFLISALVCLAFVILTVCGCCLDDYLRHRTRNGWNLLNPCFYYRQFCTPLERNVTETGTKIKINLCNKICVCQKSRVNGFTRYEMFCCANNENNVIIPVAQSQTISSSEREYQRVETRKEDVATEV